MPLADLHLRAARAAIAAAVLETLPEAALGNVVLRADQQLTVSRAARDIRRVGGCLIAEDVGRGLTYVALALARGWARPLVVAPASLRSTWHAAMRRAGISCAFESHEGLSTGRMPAGSHDGIIVDESHHFRTTTTRRYAALTTLAAHVPIVLLSATPLQNRVRDLAAQVALFLGERAFTLQATQLSHFVIRADAALAGMPEVVAPEWLPVEVDDSRVLAAILALAPAARPSDGGDAGVLRTIALVRAWASSRAALLATLRERQRLATAIEQSLEAGRRPTRREARAWQGGDDAVQLGFAAMLVGATPERVSLTEMADGVRSDLASTQSLIVLLRACPDPDLARVGALKKLRALNPRSRIVAFSERAHTVTAYFAGLRADAGVGMLTANHARIASGVVAREDLLDRFAPIARGVSAPARRDEVTLLLATDLLAEGVNLQDADIVVHLDAPWNPARLAQRVGRVRRPGGAPRVRSFLLSPPGDAAVLLDTESRLRKKLTISNATIGGGFAILPHRGVPPERDDTRSTASLAGALVERVASWRRTSAPHARVLVAGVQGGGRGWLAALDDGRLVCTDANGHLTEATNWLLQSTLGAEGQGCSASEHEVADAMSDVASWLAREHVLTMSGVCGPHGLLRRTVLHWLDRIAAATARHQRFSVFPLVSHLREALQAPLSLGTERMLAALALVPPTGDVVRELSAAAHIVAHARRGIAVRSDGARLVAVIIAGGDADDGTSLDGGCLLSSAHQRTRHLATLPLGPAA